jgi:hypothetical protein
MSARSSLWDRTGRRDKFNQFGERQERLESSPLRNTPDASAGSVSVVR